MSAEITRILKEMEVKGIKEKPLDYKTLKRIKEDIDTAGSSGLTATFLKPVTMSSSSIVLDDTNIDSVNNKIIKFPGTGSVYIGLLHQQTSGFTFEDEIYFQVLLFGNQYLSIEVEELGVTVLANATTSPSGIEITAGPNNPDLVTIFKEQIVDEDKWYVIPGAQATLSEL